MYHIDKELVLKEHEKFAETYSSAESYSSTESNYGPRNTVLLEPHKIIIKPSGAASDQENYECEKTTITDETYSVSCRKL